MFDAELQEFIFFFRDSINNILALPSKIIPEITPNLTLIVVSVLFGWFYGTRAFKGLKTISIVLLSIMFYGFMKWIGVG